MMRAPAAGGVSKNGEGKDSFHSLPAGRKNWDFFKESLDKRGFSAYNRIRRLKRGGYCAACCGERQKGIGYALVAQWIECPATNR